MDDGFIRKIMREEESSDAKGGRYSADDKGSHTRDRREAIKAHKWDSSGLEGNIWRRPGKKSC